MLRTRAGRWRRCLDGGVVRGEGDRLVDLEAPEARRIHREVALVVDRLRGEVPDPAARAVLAAAAAWTPERLAAEATRFAATWPEPTPVLPPDRLRDLVVLPATGCPSNSCSFCSLYAGRSFAVLDDRTLRRHLHAVRRFMGPGLGGRDGCFLGSASALSLSAARLQAALEGVAEVLGPLRRGVAAFWDPEHAPPHDAAALAGLRARGLRRVVIGLETGDRRLRAQAGKSGDLHRLHRAIDATRGAGIQLGLTVLVGLGGPAAAAAHQAATTAVLRSLPLDASDLVYLSPIAGSMPPADLARARDQLQRALAPVTPARIVPYRLPRYRPWA